MPRPIHEQVVVITGASSGIGRATALELGHRGASVVLAARNEEALGEVARVMLQQFLPSETQIMRGLRNLAHYRDKKQVSQSMT
jgi:NADP-dependent 3-hydroxy acid dehydrogenase YdfG